MIQNLQYKTKIDTTQPFHIYYDVEMINNDQKNGMPSPKLVYNEARNNPFINCPDNYFVSIVRFSLQTPSLPVFIPQVLIGQSNVNKLIYEFAMVNTVTNAFFSQNVTYTPSNKTIPSPSPPLTFQDLTTEYYFVFTVPQWIKMLNDTLQSIATAGGIEAGFFNFDVDTSLLKFYAPQSWGLTYKLYCNNQLQTLLDSFQFNYEATPASTNLGDMWNLLVYNDNYTNTSTLNAVNYYIMKQSSTILPLLNPIKSIVFTTGLFPIQASLTSPPKVFGADANLFSNGNNSNISPIITDFEVNPSNGNTYKEQIQYIPTGEYRLIDLYGQSPVSTLELTVMWKDHFGGLHHFKLNSGCSCDIKIMFRRKDFNSVALDL
jgi:hypothetical protein